MSKTLVFYTTCCAYVNWQPKHTHIGMFGQYGDRRNNLGINSTMLWPTELTGQDEYIENVYGQNHNKYN